jgi:hypothetical protein
MPNGGPVEPRLNINPTDPANIAVSSQSTIRVQSNNTGDLSFQPTQNFVFAPGSNNNDGDTYTAFDAQGRLFWANLAGVNQLGVTVQQVDPATGQQLGGTTSVIADQPPATPLDNGGNAPSDDREGFAADYYLSSPFSDDLYLAWTRFQAPSPGAASQTSILFSRSTNHGVTWSAPITLSAPGGAEGFVTDPNISVAPNGDVFVAYHSQTGFSGGNPDGTSGTVYFLRSTDGGATFPVKNNTAFPAGQADITFNNQAQAANVQAARTLANARFWMLGSIKAYVLADPTHPGTVYMIVNDDPNNGSSAAVDHTDIRFARSTDNGVTWGVSTIVTGAANVYRVYPTASIDRFGDIVVAWYDNSRGNQNSTAFHDYLLDFYTIYSKDQGSTWSPSIQVNDNNNELDPFNGAVNLNDRLPFPPSTYRIGEYYGADLFGGTAYFAWTGNTFNGSGNPNGQQVYFDAVAIAGSLTVNGDEGGGPVNDNFLLQVDAGNPNFVDVYVNGTREYYGLLAGIAGGIQFNGLAGNNNLTIDFSNGNPIPTGGLGFDGGTGGGRNTMTLTGGAESAESYSPGPSAGSGSIAITVGGVSGSIHFANLAPVFDNVPGPLTVNGTAGNNVINYSQGSVTANGLVTVDNFELIEFTNKTALNLNGQAGDDTITVNNPNTPTGLAALNVDGGTGNDTLVVNANNNQVVTNDVAPANVNIPGATPVAVGYINIEQVKIINALDQLTGAPAPFTAIAGMPFNNVPVATFKFTDPGVPPNVLLASASSFVASIDWGDGAVSAGTIQALGTTGFQVLGSHTYSTPGPTGSYQVKVTVTDTGSLRSFTPAGGVPVTIQDNAGTSTTPSPIVTTATVGDAQLSAEGTSISPIEGTSFSGVVATFNSANPNAQAADFTTAPGGVAVVWGDGVTGHAGDGTVSVTKTGVTPNGSIFTVTGKHTYLEEASLQVQVNIASQFGSMTQAVTSAVIGDTAPLANPIQPAIAAIEGVQFSGVVAGFSEFYIDGARRFNEPLSDFTSKPPIIDWGDGSPPSLGAVIPDPAFPPNTGHFLVTGIHTYKDSGVNIGGSPPVPAGAFPVSVTVFDGDGTTALNISNTATVNDVAIDLTGILNPASDSGKYNNDGITNVAQPNFYGTSEPFSHVTLYAKGNPVGQTQAGSDGAWSITSNHLADGTYAITATAVDQFGRTTTAAPVTIVPSLVIDTVGPRITFAAFDRLTATVTYTFQDVLQNGVTPGGTGLLVQSLSDAANFSLNRVHTRPPGTYIVTGINVTPGATPLSEDVTVVFNNGKELKGGFFQIIARAKSALLVSGIQDIAGNALDGEFYGQQSASGNGVPGGDFIANIKSIHQNTPGFGYSGPLTIIGTPQPNDPKGNFPTKNKGAGHQKAAGSVKTKPIRVSLPSRNLTKRKVTITKKPSTPHVKSSSLVTMQQWNAVRSRMGAIASKAQGKG